MIVWKCRVIRNFDAMKNPFEKIFVKKEDDSNPVELPPVQPGVQEVPAHEIKRDKRDAPEVVRGVLDKINRAEEEERLRWEKRDKNKMN